jgi:hypothetical protein
MEFQTLINIPNETFKLVKSNYHVTQQSHQDH